MDLDRINELGFEKGSRWKSIILVVSFSMWWNFFIVFQCYLTFLVCTFILAFNLENQNLTLLRYAIDACYFLEVVFTLLYRKNPKYRKLKYTKGRNWFFIVLDIISLMPLELAYSFHYMANDKQTRIALYLIQNRLLRIYRIFQLETMYAMTARKASQYALLMFLQFTSKAFLISHVMCCIWANVEQSVKCDKKNYNCYIWCETNMAVLVLLNWSGEMFTFRMLWERVVVIVAMLAGFLLIFAQFYPQTLFVSMQLNNKRALYYEKLGKLQCYLRNMVSSPELKDKVLNYFMDAWIKDVAHENMENVLRNVPLALRKEIFTDIYWEAFRHSELLREINRSCKRSLSLVMKTDYYQAGQVIYYKGQEVLRMVFLVQGIIQIMAEENEESPVLSFSSGTVFGEFSLFYFRRSQALVKCKSYCELQILDIKDAHVILRDYPKDKRLILSNLQQRLTMARYTQWRKHKFSAELKMDALEVDSSMIVEDCVKWIKSQWRAIWEGHQRHKMVVRAREEGLRLPSWHRPVKPDIKIEFITNYLDLIVLSDLFEEKKDVVCLRTTFPWSIDPTAQFFDLWNKIMVTVVLFPAIVYPFCTAWLKTFPWAIYVFSYVITFLFMIDVFLQLLTAIKTKHLIITHFSSVFKRRLQQPTFYLDIMAAFPYQLYLIMNVDITRVESYEVGLPLHPAILKAHLLFSFKIPLSQSMERITFIKNCFIGILLMYWFAEAIQLVGVRELLPFDKQENWVKRFLKHKIDKEILRAYFVSFFRASVVAIGVPDYYMYPEMNALLIGFCAAKFLFFFLFCFFFGDYYGVHTIKIFAEETFLVLLNRIKKILQSIYIPSSLADFLIKTIMFQWVYDKADYLSSKSTINKSTPKDLKSKIYAQTTYKTLRSCQVFQDESMDLIIDVMEKSYLVAVPAGSALVSFGHKSHTVTIIHRGFCQLNSFIIEDVDKGLGRSMLMGPSAIFPLLSSFCNVPAPISVLTVTDCELIMIDLNDLLNVMAKHNMFKDIVEVAKEGTFLERIKKVKAGLVKIETKAAPPELVLENFKEVFRRFGKCGHLFYYCCPREFTSIKGFRRFENLYSSYLILVSLIWPCCFGLFLFISHILIPIIFVGKLINLFHIIFGFYTPYYNKDGILVTHPLYTSSKYLTSSFFLDFIIFCPVYPIYLYVYADPYKKPNFYMVLFNFFQHYLELFHIVGFIDNGMSLMKSRYLVRMVKIVVVFGIAFNSAVNLVMFFFSSWNYGGPYTVVGFEILQIYQPDDGNLLGENSIVDYYVFIANWIICSLMTSDFLVSEVSGQQLYLTYFLSFIGTFINFYLYAWISSTSIFANIGGTIYQEKINSFVKYLEFEKADDRLIECAISHYNHEWSQTHGENLRKIFQYLPIHLHEELVYPLYRPTFAKNEIFSNADEGFFKILARHVSSVYFNRGSLIIFQSESQSDIFFIHKGKCFVYDWFIMLDVGSLLGDIKRTGLMENKIYALTHVEMLKISSLDFFMILNSFDDLEASFVYKSKNSENFVKADTPIFDYQIRPVDSRDVLNAFGLQNKDIGFEDESFFEDPENSSIHLLKTWKSKPEEKMRFLVIYPGTWKMKIFTTVYLSDTFFTLLVIPTLMSFGSLTVEAFVVVGILDFFWLLIILLNFRVGYLDKTKGDVITDFKFIAKKYLTRWDGFFVDLFALLPFEFIPIAFANGVQNVSEEAVQWCRAFRLLRGYCLVKNTVTESRKLKSNVYLKYLYVFLYLISWFVILVNIYIAIATDPDIEDAKNAYKLDFPQFVAFVKSLEYVVNFITSANLWVIVPTTVTQLIYLNINAILAPYTKGWIICQILSILFVRDLATSYYKSQVVALETFLEARETSPSIINEVLNYKQNLLMLCRSENMPAFLKLAPSSLRIPIMRDLYMQHLLNSPLYKDIEKIFLEQLVARMEREIYFPGQKIVEQYDVDHRVYFIHIGEIYVMNHTREKAYVEHVIGKMTAGESFGEAQGLWFSIPHIHTYRARTLVEVIALHSKDWVDLRRSFPDISRGIFEKAKALQIL